MAIVDLQRRGQPIGRIRLGLKVKGANGKMRPQKLNTFRFTTKNQRTADAIAGLYGGQVREWEGEWEVITDRDVIGVTVPPRDQIVSQWYEMWNKGGCIRRCTSQREQISGGDCLCPHSEDPADAELVEAAAKERARLAKLDPPQACKLVTRISVMIPDLPGLGVFRLDTGSFYAAGETGDKADLLQMARDAGVFLPAEIRIEQRVRVANGRRTPYPVPILEILSTFREIASGELAAGGITAQLPPAPGQQPRALTAGAPAPSAAQPTASQSEEPPRPKDAQEVARLALQTEDPDEVARLARFARSQGWDEDMVETAPNVIEELRPFLRERWDALRQPEGGAE